MDNITSIAVGVICILIGIGNRKGKIDLLHSYHRKRVSEEDRVPFGKLVGLGMMIVGAALIAFGGLSFAANSFSFIANAILIVGLAVGLGISFFAMIKYNKGLF